MQRAAVNNFEGGMIPERWDVHMICRERPNNKIVRGELVEPPATSQGAARQLDRAEELDAKNQNH